MAVPITIEERERYCASKNITILEHGRTIVDKFKFKCDKDGYEWISTFHDIKNHNCGCPKCAGKARKTLTDYETICTPRHITVLEMASSVMRKSLVQCDICKHKWKVTLSHIKHCDSGCPRCAKKYIYKDIAFDSGWELIFYLYHLKLGSNIIRLDGRQKTHCLEYEFEGKIRKWYPDFLIDGIYYEIKPIRGYMGLGIDKNIAKQKSHPDVRWIRDNEINNMRKVVGNIKQFKQ